MPENRPGFNPVTHRPNEAVAVKKFRTYEKHALFSFKKNIENRFGDIGWTNDARRLVLTMYLSDISFEIRKTMNLREL
jgi:hypothetical protein